MSGSAFDVGGFHAFLPGGQVSVQPLGVLAVAKTGMRFHVFSNEHNYYVDGVTIRFMEFHANSRNALLGI